MAHSPGIPQVILLIETSRAYGRGLVEGIGCYVREHGPWSIYFDERGLHDPLPSWLGDWRGDGIITRTPRKADIDALQATGLPVVELFADPRLGLPHVYADMDAIARRAAEHLLNQGLRNFGFFVTDRVWWIDSRRDSFVRVLQEQGYPCLSYDPLQQRGRKNRSQTERQRIIEWLHSLPKPCGVFCASDLYAMRLTDICRSVDIGVPEQIAVLGVDNDAVICSVSFPPLSSIDLCSTQIGYKAAALLDRMMSGERLAEDHVRVEPGQVVARQSTNILAIEDADMAGAVRFIREHACRGIHVQQVADATGLSRRRLERQFHRLLGRTPKNEILRVRMERAKMLLRQTDTPVEKVSKTTGFGSFKNFARVFRSAVGMTPRAFRKKCQAPGFHSGTEP